MGDTTIIGSGEMGSALARALLRGGFSVTVWNRTTAKAEALVEEGATLAASAAAAVSASPIVIVCVSNYAATRELLQTPAVAEALAGRVLVQLSTGTPKEARELGAWARARGADYVDGAILAWPRQIGGPSAVILVSGEAPALARAEVALRCLAGGLTPMGAELGSSAALFAAVLAYLAMRWIGICHGARICEAEGLGVAGFGEVLAGLAGALAEDARHMGEVIATGRFDRPESTLATAGGDVARLVQHAEEAGIDAEVPRFAASLFRRAIAAGYGAEEHAALVKVLRKAGGAASRAARSDAAGWGDAAVNDLQDM
ncbi:3-hydroxyisobutyrate dehydrogenase [Nannocystis exedens]|uniref:3-hydroxyisobutyrate dehydrogenase n=1 Tax=Nannocystis exedens TaxID=54 RepID=A0A1I1ZW55_9BACT|nr:NAD(P)-binding domain-containing protein [Nannocystis exedens]PCC75280.1 coenzyme F420-dependent NADP oxidoreductase [Nannocystis exedens]SFE35862.1 3-hydroxyisobutyrate dehydrogenase [Nannocystis exedens]